MAQRKNFFLRTAVIGLLYAVMSLSINAQTRYLPTWESIDSRPTPQWFNDAHPWEENRGEYMIPYNILKETIQPDSGQAVKEIFFTQKGSSIYAIVPKWPGEILRIKDLLIEMPPYNPNANWVTEAYVFKIEM